ncbi:FMN-binding negative transcriptional regulator [Flavobacterium kingsejongi]|uniref:Protease n=1 Tax=Flavobacterium kingsejongi TaxID=1678728 RepID=A0A2S1LP73_9FLAO|nr:FMN-binding negative transcriptional regulator [Flavobacterium kingsejongi]AWG25462.1 protease [Flavobacterium kingsejongi]
MHIPDLYKNENKEDIRLFLEQNSFGILINQLDSKLWATHIPLELDINADGKEVLQGHIAKENPQWHSFASNQSVLAIFSGPHSYISPSWYDHENVPTWNYAAVHVYGTIKIIEGDAALSSLKKLMDKYEAFSANPVHFEDLSKSSLRQVRGIVAFEIEITSIEAVNKMSQNRDAKNHSNIITELNKTGSPEAAAVAAIMAKCPIQHS